MSDTIFVRMRGSVVLGVLCIIMGSGVGEAQDTNAGEMSALLESIADSLDTITTDPGTETTHGNFVVAKGTPAQGNNLSGGAGYAYMMSAGSVWLFSAAMVLMLVLVIAGGYLRSRVIISATDGESRTA